jgi:MFS family permease
VKPPLLVRAHELGLREHDPPHSVNSQLDVGALSPSVEPLMAAKKPLRRPPASARSRFALNAVNFFLAELTGIGSPYLSDLLRDGGWDYRSIGIATSMSGLGVSLFQPAAGYFLDRGRRPRIVLAAASIVVGACYAALPSLLKEPHITVYATLFASGLAQAFFGPLLAGLALGLVGHGHLNRTTGSNQAWNHLGDVAAALIAMAVIRKGIANVFHLIGAIALIAGMSALVIRRSEIDRDRASGGAEKRVPFRTLLKDRSVLVLLASTVLFHAAYASAFPFVALRVRGLGGSDTLVAALILVTQASMTPVALVAGRLLDRWGRKPVFAFGFVTLPVYILACGLLRNVYALVALQALGSVGPGILGVAIIAVSADLTRGTGRFHALTGASRTAMAGGAVVGPLATGFLVQRVGYELAFIVLTLVAAAAALLFVRKMPETRPDERVEHEAPSRLPGEADRQ